MIKNGRIATEQEVMDAIRDHQPFGDRPVIVLTNKPYYPEKIRAIGRLIVLCGETGRVLFSEQNNYSAVEKFSNGWKLERQKCLIGFGLDKEVAGDIRPLIRKRCEEMVVDAQRTLRQLKGEN